MEWDAISWNAIFVFIFLDFDAVRVVGTHGVQGCQVQHDQASQCQGNRDDMKCKKTVQGGIGNDIIATDQQGQIFTHHGDGAKQGNNHLCAPEGHLPPRQQITHESLGHQQHENHHAKQPEQFTRLFVGTVEQRPEHMQINHNEERRRARGMHIAN